MKCKSGKEWFDLLFKGKAPLREVPSYLSHLLQCQECVEELYSTFILHYSEETEVLFLLLSKERKEEKRNFLLVIYLHALYLMLHWRKEKKFDAEQVLQLTKRIEEMERELLQGKITPEEVIEEIKRVINFLDEK